MIKLKLFNLYLFLIQVWTFGIWFLLIRYFFPNLVFYQEILSYVVLIVILCFEGVYHFRNILILTEEDVIIKSKLKFLKDTHIDYSNIKNVNLHNNFLKINFHEGKIEKVFWLRTTDTRKVKRTLDILNQRRG